MNIDRPDRVADAVVRIKQALGDKGWIEGDADTLKYRRDWRGNRTGEALLVARPITTTETAAAEPVLTQRAPSTGVEGVSAKELFGRVHVRLRVAVRRVHWREHVFLRHLRGDGDDRTLQGHVLQL